MPASKRRDAPLDMNNLPRAVSPPQAAQVLSLSNGTYYKHIHPLVVNGTIKSITIGRQRRIITESLLAWLKAQAEREAWR